MNFLVVRSVFASSRPQLSFTYGRAVRMTVMVISPSLEKAVQFFTKAIISEFCAGNMRNHHFSADDFISDRLALCWFWHDARGKEWTSENWKGRSERENSLPTVGTSFFRGNFHLKLCSANRKNLVSDKIFKSFEAFLRYQMKSINLAFCWGGGKFLSINCCRDCSLLLKRKKRWSSTQVWHAFIIASALSRVVHDSFICKRKISGFSDDKSLIIMLHK